MGKKNEQPHDTLIDFVTGRAIPNCGAESNRQEIERFLVKTKKYDPNDIEVDAKIALDINGKAYLSAVDLVVKVNDLRFMVIKCAAGSLASREREVIAAARLLEDYQIPISVASDGTTALLWDTVSGDSLGQGMDAIPSKEDARASFDPARVVLMDEKPRNRQKLIFRAYETRSCAVTP